MEVFMDDFLVFGDSFSSCLANLDKILKRCEDTKLALNWEKSHFMVKEGIVLGHKISRKGIEVDKAKVDVISKLPHPTTVKGIKSFLGHAGFYRRFITIYSKISRPRHLLREEHPFHFLEIAILLIPLEKRSHGIEKAFPTNSLVARQWMKAEDKLSTRHKEMLAVVYALRSYDHIAHHEQGVLFTRTIALKILFNKKEQSKIASRVILLLSRI
ncbi:reverse transcriptase domain-containing protein [Tanacetum coccineum]